MNLKYNLFFLLAIMVSAVYAESDEDSTQETEFKTITVALSKLSANLRPSWLCALRYANTDSVV